MLLLYNNLFSISLYLNSFGYSIFENNNRKIMDLYVIIIKILLKNFEIIFLNKLGIGFKFANLSMCLMTKDDICFADLEEF